MDVTIDAPAARPIAVAFVNCVGITTFGRAVHLIAGEERRLRSVLAVVQGENDDPAPVAPVGERFDRGGGGDGPLPGSLFLLRVT
jgi:hypothetical protein